MRDVLGRYAGFVKQLNYIRRSGMDKIDEIEGRLEEYHDRNRGMVYPPEDIKYLLDYIKKLEAAARDMIDAKDVICEQCPEIGHSKDCAACNIECAGCTIYSLKQIMEGR